VTGDLDLKGLLESAAEGEPPPVAGPAGVFQRADAIRRRRRWAATGLAGVMTFGVLAAGVAITSGLGGAKPDGDGSALPAAPGTVAVTPSASASVSPAALAPVSLLHTLRGLVPPGGKVRAVTDEANVAKLVITDDGGRTLVEVDAQPGFLTTDAKTPASALLGWFDCATRAVPAGAHCTAETLPDKTRLVTVTGPAGEPGAPEVRIRQVDLLTPGGGRLVATAWNAVNVKSGPVTRPEPALDLGQLRKIATSGRWWA
jgi:hypothetical protein